MLSSSFAMTPAVVKRKLRLVPTSRISEELLSKSVSRQDFIRIIPNPGFRPNSMKNVPKAAPSVSASNGASLNPPYAVCAPRKLQLLQQQYAQMASLNSTGAAGSALQRSGSRQNSLDSLGAANAGEGPEGKVSTKLKPLKHYMRPSSLNCGSKQRFKKFDYASVNVRSLLVVNNFTFILLISIMLKLC